MFPIANVISANIPSGHPHTYCLSRNCMNMIDVEMQFHALKKYVSLIVFLNLNITKYLGSFRRN